MASPWSPGSDKVFWDISGEQFEADSIDGDRGETGALNDATTDTSVAGGDASGAVAATERAPVLQGVSVTSVGSVVADDTPASGDSTAARASADLAGADVGNAEERCQTPDSLDHAISDKKFGNFKTRILIFWLMMKSCQAIIAN